MIELSADSQVTMDGSTSWWNKRTYFEKKLLFGIAFISGLIFSFLIDAVLHSGKQQPPQCESVPCILVSSDILNQIDESVDPCNDFYKFCCGQRISRTHENDFLWGTIKYNLEKEMRNILSHPINTNDHPALQYEKKLFLACQNEAKNGTSLDVFKSMMKDMGGWPVLMGENWNGKNFQLMDIIEKLTTTGLYNQIIFQAYLKEKSSERYINVLVYPASVRSITYRNKHVYQKSMVDHVIALGADESIANEDMAQTFEFILKIQNTTMEISNEEEKPRVKISHLQKNYKLIDLKRYFELVIRSVDSVTEEDYVVLPYSSFMENVFNLFNATNNRIIANYIFWSATYNIMPLVSNELLNLKNQLECYSENWPQDRTEHCQQELMQIIYPNPSYFAFIDKRTPVSTRKKVQEMFDLIVKEFKKLIAINTWMDEDSKNKSYQWLNKIELKIGFEAEAVDKVYNKLYKPISNNEAFLTSFLKLNKEILLYKSNDKDTAWENFYAPDAEYLVFRGEHNIVVPAGMLEGIYFDENRPMFTNYAILGKSMASVLVYEYLHFASTYDLKLWSKEVQKNYNNKTSCVRHNSEYYGEEGNVFRSSKYYKKQYKIGNIIGMKLAYNAHKTWTQENKKEFNLIGLNYTNSQMFWIHSLSNVCFEEIYLIGYRFYSDSEAVAQNFDFAIDFHCDLNAKMNPSNKCIIFYI
ncbi:hypothetical protein FQR65_LT06855 [Abscondita terminalis]|nr:hypothetical protein FQR65_LT06855 [Abscondita terminalis]